MKKGGLKTKTVYFRKKKEKSACKNEKIGYNKNRYRKQYQSREVKEMRTRGRKPKFSEDIINAAVADYENTDMTLVEVGEKYGMSTDTVRVYYKKKKERDQQNGNQ